MEDCVTFSLYIKSSYIEQNAYKILSVRPWHLSTASLQGVVGRGGCIKFVMNYNG